MALDAEGFRELVFDGVYLKHDFSVVLAEGLLRNVGSRGFGLYVQLWLVHPLQQVGVVLSGPLKHHKVKTVCRPVRRSAIVQPLVDALLLLGVWLLVDLKFLKARIHNMADVVQRLRL